MSFHTPVQAFSTILLLLSCGYALVCGGRPERIVAVLFFADWTLSPLLQNHDAFSHTQLAIFALDGALMVALLTICMTTDRFWPLWTVSFQILELLMHFAMLIDHKVHARAYYIGVEIWSDLMLVSIAVGTWFEAHKRRRMSMAESTS